MYVYLPNQLVQQAIINKYSKLQLLLILVSKFIISMLRSILILNLGKMGVVKGKVLNKHKSSIEQVSKLFHLEVPNSKQAERFYLQAIEKNSIREWNKEIFLKNNQKYQILKLTKQCIAKNYQNLDSSAEKALMNFINFCINLMMHVSSAERNQKDVQVSAETKVQIADSVSEFFMLIPLNLDLCMKYLRVLSMTKKMKHHIAPPLLFNNIKHCFHFITKHVPVSQLNISIVREILFHLHTLHAKIIMYEQFNEIILFFWRLIKDSWFKNQKHGSQIAQSLILLGYYHPEINSKAIEMLKRQSNLSTEEIQNLLLMVIKSKHIHRHNYQDYAELICSIKDKCPDKWDFYSKTYYIFLMAGIWIPEYWVQFFQLLKTKHNLIAPYYILTIEKALEKFKQSIGAQIVQAWKPIFKKCQQKINLSRQSILKGFYLAQTNSKSLGCQNQLTVALRIMNAGIVRSEEFVELFCIDILINKQYAIQVNGSTHFITNLETLKVEYNVKTQFRTQYLKKCGYKIININLREYNEASFEIIREIYKIITEKGGNQNQTVFELPKHLNS